MAEIWRKGTTKRVRGDHNPADVVHHLPELCSALNARDILLQATDQNVTQIRTHFHPTQKQKIMLCSQLARPETVPAAIVLCDHHAVEPQALRFVDQIDGTQIT